MDTDPRTSAGEPATWAGLLEAYRRVPGQPQSELLLRRLGPWLVAGRRQLKAVPPLISSDDIAQQLALEVLAIAGHWVPACEDRWIPRRLVERAARRVSEALIRERLRETQELDEQTTSPAGDEPARIFDTPIGQASAADLKVIYRAKVLGEPVEKIALQAGVQPQAIRRRLRTALARARRPSTSTARE